MGGSHEYKVPEGLDPGNRLAVSPVAVFTIDIRVLFWSNIGSHDSGADALELLLYPCDPLRPCPNFVKKTEISLQ